jgi:hypothetical protein
MLSSQEEQFERLRVFAQDNSLREKTGTYLSHTHDDIHQGRFAAIGPAVVIGTKAGVASAYPAAAAHQHDPCGPEPALGYSVDAMPDLEVASLVSTPQATGGPTDPATSLAVDRGSPLSSENMAAQCMSQMASAGKPSDVRTERSPTYRRF